MKTINKDIDIFDNLNTALRAFSKCDADLLYSPTYKSYYVDRSKSAYVNWPQLYVKMNPLKTEFEVRDALRGTVTGNWEKDSTKLAIAGYVTLEKVYWEAYDNTVNP